MNTPARKPIVPAPLTDAALDSALRDDSILPSSGFAASVMDAMTRESAAAAGLRFPWMRALPGLILAALTALAVLVMFIGAIVSLFSHAVTSSAASLTLTAAPFDGRLHWQSLLHNTAAAVIVWPLAALLLCGFCLLLCRRLIASH